MSIQKRLYILIITACVGLIGEGLFCLTQLSRVYAAADYANANAVPSILAIDKIADGINRLRFTFWRGLMLSTMDESHYDKHAEEKMDMLLHNDVIESVKEYKNKLATDETDRHLLNEVYVSLLEYDNLRIKVKDLLDSGKKLEGHLFLADNQKIVDRLFNAIKAHRAYNADLGTKMAEEAKSVQKRATIITVVIMMGTMFLVGLIGVATARSVIHPLEKLQTVVANVTKTGDFSKRIHINSRDEVGLTALAFDQLMESQQRAIGQVNTVVTQIAEGDFSPRIEMDLQGDLCVMKDAVNASVERIKETMDGLGEVMTALHSGEFNRRVANNHAEGEFKQAVDKATQAMETMEAMLDDIGQVMNDVAQGDLRHRVCAEGRGDFARLKENINLSLDTLEQAFKLINTNTHQVATAATQASSAVEQITGGAHTQMYALNQIVTAIRQTVSSITEVSGSAEVASQKSREAVNIVREGKEKMGNLVTLVTGITVHSERISKITEVIEKFANKTNLLSLNAAIEAARAGEHGRGFAVVADEVGKLAVSSAKSAHEIAQLVRQAAEEAYRALKAVQEVSVDMEHIESGSVQADAMMERISEALEQQSDAVREVQANIADLNKIAEINAITSEQITASVVELSRLADSTRNEVERFRL